MSVLSRLLGRSTLGLMQDAPDATPVTVEQIVTWTSCSVLLRYPDAEQRHQLPTIAAALAETGVITPEIRTLVELLGGESSGDVQTRYVQEFDLSRRHSLHLTYWTDGDTRRRGEALSRFKQVYRSYGAEFDDHELPDFLPMVLEFAARVAPELGYQLLQQYRPSIELLRLALLDDGLPWAAALELLCATLPGPSPSDRQAAMALGGYTDRPPEQVGIEPYGLQPRLQPPSDSACDPVRLLPIRPLHE